MKDTLPSANPVDYRQRLYDAYVRATGARPANDAREIAARRPYLEQLIAAHFPADREVRIIDLGCGGGVFLHIARNAGYMRSRGVDRSLEQIDLARGLGLDCVEQGDALDALRQAPPESVDVIVALDVLEHFTKSEVIEFLDATSLALAKGGRLILHVPNAESPFGGAIRHGDFTHELAFTRQSISQLAAVTGFRTVACFEDAPVPHGLKSGLRRALWSLVRLCYRLLSAVETGDTGKQAIFTRNMLVVLGK